MEFDISQFILLKFWKFLNKNIYYIDLPTSQTSHMTKN